MFEFHRRSGWDRGIEGDLITTNVSFSLMDQRQKQQPWIWLSTAFLETSAVMDALRRDEQIPLTEREREREWKQWRCTSAFVLLTAGTKSKKGAECSESRVASWLHPSPLTDTQRFEFDSRSILTYRRGERPSDDRGSNNDSRSPKNDEWIAFC